MKEETNITAQTKQPEDKSNSGRVVSYVPFYDDGQIKIYNGNFESVLPQLDEKIDVIITDPPYPDRYVDEYNYYDGILNFLAAYDCRQLIFWSVRGEFPLDYTAIHIWDRKNNIVPYERIFERNGNKKYRLFSYLHLQVGNKVTASLARDVETGHPSQKPIMLMSKLVNDFTKPDQLIFDPFMGSGSTLLAAKKLGRRAIGIEMNKRWCEVAAKRLCQYELFR